MKRYKHIFFDLDHTLWDFEGNSRSVLAELHHEDGFGGRGIPVEAFIQAYEQVNAVLWERLENGSIDRGTLHATRFQRTLMHLGVHDNAMASRMERSYMERCPARTGLMEGAAALLEDLRGAYRLHIITNGHTEVQLMKLQASGIRRHFAVVLTSEQAGAPKPSAAIFRHALRSAGAKPGESLMVGDNARSDIAGARAAGIDQAHFGPVATHDPEATYRISKLDELRAVLLQGSVRPEGELHDGLLAGDPADLQESK